MATLQTDKNSRLSSTSCHAVPQALSFTFQLAVVKLSFPWHTLLPPPLFLTDESTLTLAKFRGPFPVLTSLDSSATFDTGHCSFPPSGNALPTSPPCQCLSSYLSAGSSLLSFSICSVLLLSLNMPFGLISSLPWLQRLPQCRWHPHLSLPFPQLSPGPHYLDVPLFQ